MLSIFVNFIFGAFLPLDEAVASRVIFGIVSESDWQADENGFEPAK